jgi:hypothetical protein
VLDPPTDRCSGRITIIAHGRTGVRAAVRPGRRGRRSSPRPGVCRLRGASSHSEPASSPGP